MNWGRHAPSMVAAIAMCVTTANAVACPPSVLMVDLDGLPSCVDPFDDCRDADCEIEAGATHAALGGYVFLQNTCEETLVIHALECPYCDIAVPRIEPGRTGRFVVDDRWVGDIPDDDTPYDATLGWELGSEEGTFVVGLLPEVNPCGEAGGCSMTGSPSTAALGAFALWAMRPRRRRRCAQ